MNLVPFSQFAKELANNTLPAYSFITPNICNDAHNCTLATADNWLKTHINPLIQNPSFQNGLLIIVFDESANDNTHGGGRVAWVAISPMHSKAAYKPVTLYQHQNTLRLMLQALGLASYPGKASATSNVSEFFK
ncbi:MAG TPA: alkaline phosphatase family protein [Terriglobales bacterium]|nr:alkaline phosphatase family protein [Terriglobales bacterium]